MANFTLLKPFFTALLVMTTALLGMKVETQRKEVTVKHIALHIPLRRKRWSKRTPIILKWLSKIAYFCGHSYKTSSCKNRCGYLIQ
jgi:hypothetical protein